MRSQTSTEYLILLGMVLVVAVIVVGTVSDISFIGGDADEGTDAAVLATLPVGIVDYVVYEYPLQLRLRNNQHQPVKVTSLLVSGHNCEITPFRLALGETKHIWCSYNTSTETYMHTFQINYTLQETGVRYSIDDEEYVLAGNTLESIYSCPNSVTVPYDIDLNGVACESADLNIFLELVTGTRSRYHWRSGDVDCSGAINANDIAPYTAACP